MRKRFREHKHYAKHDSKLPVHAAMRKYGDRVIYELMLVGSTEYCLLMENRLRPLPNIGWNISVGGEKSPMAGRKHSQSTKEGARKRALEMPKEQRENANSYLRKTEAGSRPWVFPNANKNVWKLAGIANDYLLNNPSHSYTRVSKFLNLDNPYSAYALWKKISKDKWNPYEDEEWLSWVKTN